MLLIERLNIGAKNKKSGRDSGDETIYDGYKIRNKSIIFAVKSI